MYLRFSNVHVPLIALKKKNNNKAGNKVNPVGQTGERVYGFFGFFSPSQVSVWRSRLPLICTHSPFQPEKPVVVVVVVLSRSKINHLKEAEAGSRELQMTRQRLGHQIFPP